MDAKPQKKQRPKSLYEQAKENEIVGSEYIEVVPATGLLIPSPEYARIYFKDLQWVLTPQAVDYPVI